MTRTIIVAAFAFTCAARPAAAVPCHGQNMPACTFTGGQPAYNSFSSTLAAMGAPLRQIDFETLPDGSPSHAGPIYITPTFNYTEHGATFSSALPYPSYYPYISGPGPGNY